MGRKKALAASALFSLIGAAWTAGSPYLAMLITIRILHGFGLGMQICLVPLYLTEVSPAHCRGVMTGMTVMGFGVGYVAYVTNKSAWTLLTNCSVSLGFQLEHISQRIRACNGDCLLHWPLSGRWDSSSVSGSSLVSILIKPKKSSN